MATNPPEMLEILYCEQWNFYAQNLLHIRQTNNSSGKFDDFIQV